MSLTSATPPPPCSWPRPSGVWNCSACPAPHDSSRQSREDQGFSRADFALDWDDESALLRLRLHHARQQGGPGHLRVQELRLRLRGERRLERGPEYLAPVP